MPDARSVGKRGNEIMKTWHVGTLLPAVSVKKLGVSYVVTGNGAPWALCYNGEKPDSSNDTRGAEAHLAAYCSGRISRRSFKDRRTAERAVAKAFKGCAGVRLVFS